jgi:hypothetical protein
MVEWTSSGLILHLVELVDLMEIEKIDADAVVVEWRR